MKKVLVKTFLVKKILVKKVQMKKIKCYQELPSYKRNYYLTHKK